jgi:hypothetical protein
MSPAEVLNDQSWLDVAGLPQRSSRGLFQMLSFVGVTWSEVLTPPPRRPWEDMPPLDEFALLGQRHRVLLRIDRVARDDGPRRAPARWPRGPGHCDLAVPSDIGVIRAFPTSVRFGFVGGGRSGSLWVSLGRAGGRVLASLARPWGLEGLPGSVALQGQAIAVPAGGSIWVNDWARGDDLVLQVPPGRSMEVCGLSGPGEEEA